MIKASTIVLYGKKLTKEDIFNEVRKFSNSKTGYIIAFPDELDGKEFPLETAIDKFFSRHGRSYNRRFKNSDNKMGARIRRLTQICCACEVKAV